MLPGGSILVVQKQCQTAVFVNTDQQQTTAFVFLVFRGYLSPVPPLYDAHQHFHFDPLTPHRARIAADLRAVGLKRAVVNATNEEEWPVVATLAREHAWILPSHGIHPWDCGNRSPAWLDNLRDALLADPRAGIGEIGLDRWIIDGVRHQRNRPRPLDH